MCVFIHPRNKEETTPEEIAYVAKFYDISEERAKYLLQHTPKKTDLDCTIFAVSREQKLEVFERVKSSAQEPSDSTFEAALKRHRGE